MCSIVNLGLFASIRFKLLNLLQWIHLFILFYHRFFYKHKIRLFSIQFVLAKNSIYDWRLSEIRVMCLHVIITIGRD